MLFRSGVHGAEEAPQGRGDPGGVEAPGEGVVEALGVTQVLHHENPLTFIEVHHFR